MRLSEICIHRPVLSCVIHLILVVIGVVCFQRITLQYFPSIPNPVATVSTNYPGANADLIETQITDVLEGGLSNVPGVESMSSWSSPGSSSITIHFRLGGDFDEEVNAVRDAVASVRERMPTAAQSPIVTVGGVERPVLNLGFYDEHKTPEEMRDYIVRFIQPTLAEIQGVGAVWVFGSGDYALRIWLRPEKMAALNVTVSDVMNTLNGNNVDFPAGQVYEPNRVFTIVPKVQLKTPEQFQSLTVKNVAGKLVFLRDVATVAWGNVNMQRSPMLINGKVAIDVEVRPRYGENPLIVAQHVRDSLQQLTANLPHGMHLFVTYDQSQFLKSALRETGLAILFAVILVALVIYLFLGSWRGALIPLVTIPLCLIDVFIVMVALGFTLNIMTLLAMVLAIGLVVDDAIVVLENMHRHVEAGMAPIPAALQGIHEISFPVISMTLTLAAVYAPLGFAQGLSALVLREFAFTLAGSVMISGFIALTLSPMMCSRIIIAHEKENRLQRMIERGFTRLSDYYRRQLQRILTHRFWVLCVSIGIAVAGIGLYRTMPAEFLPAEDIGYFTTTIIPPVGATIDYIERQMHKLDQLYQAEPAIAYYASFVLSNGPTSFVSLKPWGVRHETLSQLLKKLAPQMRAIPGVIAYTEVPRAVDLGGDDDDNDVTLQIMSTESYAHLAALLQKISQHLKTYPGLQDIQNHLQFNNQQYQLTLKRDAISTYGVDPQDIANTVSTMMGGSHVTDVMLGDRSYEVLVQMQKKDLNNFQVIHKLFVHGVSGAIVPLSNVVELKPLIGQVGLAHYNRMRAGSITAQLAPHYTTSTVVQYLNQVLPKYLTPTEHFTYSGRIKEFLDSRGDMMSLFLLSLIFIYLILAAQFESFIDPFVILLAVPLSMVGALVVLALAGGTLNLYTNIGMITLVGLVAKHGILITQFANQLKHQGRSLSDAIVEAAGVRLRPILMTTAAMVLGSLPLVLSNNPGTRSHQEIGWVIIGGLLLGTFFSLVVVPVAYYYLARFKKN